MEEYIVEILGSILVALAGYIGIAIKSLIKRYINDNTKRSIASAVVSAVEQIFTDIHGEEKFDEAKNRIVKILNTKGIKITDDELDVLVEDAVRAMNLNTNNWLISATDSTMELTEDETVEEITEGTSN